MNKYCVVGNPVNHSLSPQIHNHFAKQFGISLSYEKVYAENFIKGANKIICDWLAQATEDETAQETPDE